ncbi:hypothetical protein FCIRC_6055 [Fusarium circinatum]|uniref:Uncharacterized protein n=1 Tax=Fusarium circinatum TaxID=48490 RepID=A0A8H5U1U0_FUSCI|nr:hypothetical protein FCIRC_6055 [Fusarium circinatum]
MAGKKNSNNPGKKAAKAKTSPAAGTKRKADDITADEATPAPGAEKPNSVASRCSDASGAAGPLLNSKSSSVSSLDYLIQTEDASVNIFEISEADMKSWMVWMSIQLQAETQPTRLESL